jgi:hypothetical protein
MLSDTSLEIEEAQLQLLRLMTPSDRSALAAKMSTEVIRASKRAIARLNPNFTPRQVEHYYIELHYGKELADGMRDWERNRENV